jgi:hypothetical protein
MISETLRLNLIFKLSPLEYIKSLGFKPFEWQAAILESNHKRKHINGARQAGKSTLISSKPSHRAKFFPGSLSVVIAATEKQAVENMGRIKDFMRRDATYPKIERSGDSLIELDNHSRIIVVPATETAARGYSSPDIIMLDEDSRIDDIVYKSGIRPMLTNNAKCELLEISTPNGRLGHFYKASISNHWERYEIRAPYEIQDMQLVAAESEAHYRARRKEKGIRAYYSPRHANLEEQQENLDEMSELMYRQEYLCEYVEPQGQTFSYDEIDSIFKEGARPLDLAIIAAPIKALEFI